MFTLKDQEKFWSKVSKGSITECWPWKGGTNGKNYGCFRDCCGTVWGAHRVAIILIKGHIAKGKVVRHLCNNSICVNPLHLAEGSQADNVGDYLKTGVYPKHPVKEPSYTQEIKILNRCVIQNMAKKLLD